MSFSRKVRRHLSRPIRFDSIEELQAFLLAHPMAAHVVVEHDAQCSAEVCRCSPTYSLEPLTPENVQKGAQGQARWVNEGLN